jgi:hypothetical protein
LTVVVLRSAQTLPCQLFLPVGKFAGPEHVLCDSDCCAVVRRKRSTVVLLNNAPTQMLADTKIDEEHGFKVINLSNLKLVFLPANTTSVVQLLDQGIIACTKAHYRRQLVQWVIAEAQLRSLRTMASRSKSCTPTPNR